ncbi:MAG TPA: hypothetical protein VI583_11170 [Cyclobacteriaceae bacterium]|nr:hypothetical protein [Cyclobacteriaceae bacterium]
MKINDSFTKRFLAVCLGISAILLSGSILVTALSFVPRLTAKPVENRILPAGMNHLNQVTQVSLPDSLEAGNGGQDVYAIHVFGLGIREGVIYFGILYNNNTIGLHKTDYTSGDIIQW